MLQAIRMCFRTKLANGDNTSRLLVSLRSALGTNFTLGIIPLLATVRLNLQKTNYFKKNWGLS